MVEDYFAVQPASLLGGFQLRSLTHPILGIELRKA